MALCYFRTMFCEKLTGRFNPSCNFVALGFRGTEQKHIKNPEAINQTVKQTSLFQLWHTELLTNQGPEDEDRMSAYFLLFKLPNLSTCGAQVAAISTSEK